MPPPTPVIQLPPPLCTQVSANTWELLAESEEWLATGGVEIKGKGKMETFFWQPPADFLGDAATMDAPEPASDLDPTTADPNPDPTAQAQPSADMNVGQTRVWAAVMGEGAALPLAAVLPHRRRGPASLPPSVLYSRESLVRGERSLPCWLDPLLRSAVWIRCLDPLLRSAAYIRFPPLTAEEQA